MKKILLIINILFFNVIFSQSNILKVEYNEFVNYSNTFKYNYTADLFVSSDFSFYKTDFTVKNDNKKSDTGSIILSEENDNFSEIVVNRKNKILKERLYENIFLMKYFSTIESIPNFNWKLIEGKKNINKFICKQAVTNFRGRTYKVWYTEEIPISSGPWKFNGLPGLILEVNDNNGLYNWNVKSISYPFKGKTPNFKSIFDEKNKFKEIAYKDFDTKKINAIKDKIETIKSRSNSRGKNTKYEYNTFQEKEPINEWRSQRLFK